MKRYDLERRLEEMEQCIHYFPKYQRGQEITMAYCELFGHSCFRKDWLSCMFYHDKESPLMNLLNQKIKALQVSIESEKKAENPNKDKIRALEHELKICLRNIENKELKH